MVVGVHDFFTDDVSKLGRADRETLARESVKEFRKLQGTLTAYARMLTGNQKMRVEVSRESNGSTDGARIYYRPPLELGLKPRHNRSLCDKRDELLQLKCPACAAREAVLVVIYHEIAHLAFGSFDKVSENDLAHFTKESVRETEGYYAEQILKRIEAAPYWQRGEFMPLAHLISEWLPILLNAIEDSRVNRMMFKARPGTKVMFDALIKKIMDHGVLQLDNTHLKWSEYPLNHQVLLGTFCVASKYDISGWFHPKVEEDLKDKELCKLLLKVDKLKTVSGSYRLAFPVLVRLRELGYCQLPEDPEEPEKDDEPESTEEDGEGSQDASSSPEDGEDVGPGGEGGSESGDESSKHQDGTGGESGESSVSDSEDSEGESTDSNGEDGTSGSSGSQESDSNSGEESSADGGSGNNGESSDGDRSSEQGNENESAKDSGSEESTKQSSGDDQDSDGNSESEGRPGEQQGGDGQGAPESEGNDSRAEKDGSGSSKESQSSYASDSGGDGSGGGRFESGVGSSDGDDVNEKGNTSDSILDENGSDESGQGGSHEDKHDGVDSSDSEGDSTHDKKQNGSLDDTLEESNTDGDPESNPSSGHESTSSSGDLDDRLNDTGDSTDSGSNASSSTGDNESGREGGSTSEDSTSTDSNSDNENDDREAEGNQEETDASWTLPEAEEDAEPVDTGEDLGQGGITTEASDLPMGTPEEGKAVLLSLGDHEDAPGSYYDKMEEKRKEKELKEIFDKAIVQSVYFETGSTYVRGVREHYYDDHIINKDGSDASSGWSAKGQILKYGGYSLEEAGVEGDFDPEESQLGPALLRLRKIFADNETGGQERHKRSGRVDRRSLGKRAPVGDDRVFHKKWAIEKMSYLVIIGIDISGSTYGENLVMAKKAALAQAILLHRLGISFVVLAHSAYYDETERSLGTNVDIYHIKDEHEPWTEKTAQRLRDLCPAENNLDGHTIEYYRKLAMKSTATERIIMYYTDGKMPAENHDEELEILQREIRYAQRDKITLMGVGIRTDSPIKHGLDTVRIDSGADIINVVRHLEKRLGNR